MKKVAEFNITESFNVTYRGFLIVGTEIYGKIETGNYIIFSSGDKEYRRKIRHIEFSSNPYQIVRRLRSFVIELKSEEEKAYFKIIKLLPQIAVVVAVE